MPFGPGDEAYLLQTLGTGEVTARINAIGWTEIKETAFAGIWLVEHRSPEDARLAFHIEVAEVPFLLRTPKEDLEAARRRLETSLAEFDVRDLDSFSSARS
jgi:hydrogenase-1 operon protein HyaF